MTLTLTGNIADIVSKEVKIRGYETTEDMIYEAMQALARERIEEGINKGLQAVQDGEYEEITNENIDEFVDSIVNQAYL